MTVFSQKIKVLSLAIVCLLVSACTTNRATGERQFTAFVNEQQEHQIGYQEHSKIIKAGGLYDDKAVQDYVSKVGGRLTPYSEYDMDYTFSVMDSPDINAFATPGGYIYVHRGIMLIMNDESQLAALLGPKF